MSLIKVTNDNFKKEVIEAKTSVLVDFNADWCGPCQMLKPVLEDLSKKANFKIVSINIDEESELADEYEVYSIPCLVVFKDGQEIKRNVGFIPEEEILNLVGEK